MMSDSFLTSRLIENKYSLNQKVQILKYILELMDFI